MELKEILAVSGQPGLYRYLAQSTNGVIVESLTDKKRMNFPSNARVSSMAEIAVFTDAEDLPLAEVFEKLYAHTSGKETISHKASPEEMKTLFATVVPGYDRERVHISDIKKIISWFNLLVASGMKEFKLPEEGEETPDAPAKGKETKAPKAAPKDSAKQKGSTAAKGVSKAQMPRPKV